MPPSFSSIAPLLLRCRCPSSLFFLLLFQSHPSSPLPPPSPLIPSFSSSPSSSSNPILLHFFLLLPLRLLPSSFAIDVTPPSSFATDVTPPSSFATDVSPPSSFPFLPFLLTFFSLSSFSLLFPPPPIPSFSSSLPLLIPPLCSSSSSSSNPIYEAFKTTLPFHVDLSDPALPPPWRLPPQVIPSFPFFPSSSLPSPCHPSPSSSNSTILLLSFLLLLSHSSPLLLPPAPIIPSMRPLALPLLHANLHGPALLLHGSSLHLRPFLTSDLSFPLFPFLLTAFSFLSSFTLLFSHPSPLIPLFFSSFSSSSNPTLLLFLFLLQSTVLLVFFLQSYA